MSITGPSFISIQVRDLARSAAFYESVVGLRRAAVSPPHAVVFDTSPIAFAIRDAEPGTDLTAQPLGVGVRLFVLEAADQTPIFEERERAAPARTFQAKDPHPGRLPRNARHACPLLC